MSNYALARRTQSKRITNDSKSKISDVALNLFTQKGIKSTTTKEIAKRAGIAEGTIYKHFKSKDDIALELFISKMDLFREKLLENTRSFDNSKDILRSLIQAFFYFAKNHPKDYSFIMESHRTELKKVSRERGKPKDIFVDVIRSGMQKQEFREMDENLGAALVIGMVTRTILFFNNGLIGSDYNKVISDVSDAALKVLESQ
ncbi:MAG TPA: TetR/AcrR family transcriptional regulator [Thermodesulfobacteriota bacterium]|nr:TetR/AcrR family transcriptional regulator [Thermodesulfobacteriota bacterium]